MFAHGSSDILTFSFFSFVAPFTSPVMSLPDFYVQYGLTIYCKHIILNMLDAAIAFKSPCRKHFLPAFLSPSKSHYMPPSNTHGLERDMIVHVL